MSHVQMEDAPLIAVNPVKLRREAATFGRFAAVGLLGAVIDFTVLNLLIFGLGWSSPLQMVLANVVSTLTAVVSNYFFNRKWTFRSTTPADSRVQFLQFLAVSAVGLVINAVIFFIANQFIFGPLLHTGFSVQLSKAAAIGVTMFWNFGINRVWTFRQRKEQPPELTLTEAIVEAVETPLEAAVFGSVAAPGAAVAPQADGEARAKRARGGGFRRWVLPLGVGLALLALLNAGLYLRLSGAKVTAQPTAAQQAAAQQAAAQQPAAQQPAQPATQPAAAQPAAAQAAPTPGPAAPAVAATALGGAGATRLAATFQDGAAPSGWQAFAGDWKVVDGALTQQQKDGYDKGDVYNDTFTNYVFSTRFKLIDGIGAGVYFNLPNQNSKNGGHMVRYTDDGAGVFWGYFKPDGSFQGQGFAATAAPGNDWHVLEVLSGPSTYAVKLDGKVLGQDAPLLSTNGHIGLTTSQAVAAFAAVDVADLSAAPAGQEVQQVQAGQAVQVGQAVTGTTPVSPALSTGGIAFSAISGDWKQEGDVVTQENNKATDFSLGTGIAAENYTLETLITLPNDAKLADAGAGILFHMPARDKKEGARMVRFVNGGKGITWGEFGADGAFVGDGYVELNLPAGETQKLTLAVHGQAFDVLVNDKAIVKDVPTNAGQGWIGLLTYRGPIRFETVKLTLGSVVP